MHYMKNPTFNIKLKLQVRSGPPNEALPERIRNTIALEVALEESGDLALTLYEVGECFSDRAELLSPIGPKPFASSG